MNISEYISVASLNGNDYDLLDKMTKYGFVAEYVYLDKNKEIRSKVLDPADCYPVFNHRNEYESLIEHYTVDNVSNYNIYYPDKVEQWTDEGGNLRMIDEFINVGGLPVLYRNQSEIDNLGRSDLLDILPILDNMEDLMSKATDGYYHYITGIPVMRGQQLKGDGLPKDLVSGGIVIDHLIFSLLKINLTIKHLKHCIRLLQVHYWTLLIFPLLA